MRHCESLFNEHEATYSGEPFDEDCLHFEDLGYLRDWLRLRDCGLSARGICQAQRIRLDVQPDLVVCSPLRRCRETLRHAGIDAPVVFTDLCREHMTDVCDFFEHEDPEADAEDTAALLDRVTRFKAFLRHLGQWYPRILVVSHADFIWHMTSRVVMESGPEGSRGEAESGASDGGAEGSRGEAAEKYGQWLGNGETCDLKLKR